ncbi:Ribokinase-like protein [Dunaliella salina]|uniref:Ribokinase-like protein n=1 Tax=Dunaliella salina TaxID=3046 RepID=A0ABQ7FZZ5_DUNSA|nr:Ribokinase-like protein [Dunaliella salina]|eukprot:KAF5827923.1 Ribokinase-like protein [Dunaliella salina]
MLLQEGILVPLEWVGCDPVQKAAPDCLWGHACGISEGEGRARAALAARGLRPACLAFSGELPSGFCLLSGTLRSLSWGCGGMGALRWLAAACKGRQGGGKGAIVARKSNIAILVKTRLTAVPILTKKTKSLTWWTWCVLPLNQSHSLKDMDVLAVAPAAIVDQVVTTHDPALAEDLFGDCQGGSKRASAEELQSLFQALQLKHVHSTSRPAGSVPNVARNLAKILAKEESGGVRLVTACGYDANGVLFLGSMKRAGVDTSQVLHRQAPTGQCVIVSCDGQRTMRTCIHPEGRLHPHDLVQEQFQKRAEVAWVFTSAYTLYTDGLLQTIVGHACQNGRCVALDLASQELVSSQRSALCALLEQGCIDVCICNEDEAVQLGQGKPVSTDPQAHQVRGSGTEQTRKEPHSLQQPCIQALSYLAQHCKVAAVVTLGSQGCLVAPGTAASPEQLQGLGTSRSDQSMCFYPSMDVEAVDCTGAGANAKPAGLPK